MVLQNKDVQVLMERMDSLTQEVREMRAVVARISPRRHEDGASHIERVLEVMRGAKSSWLTATEIAEQAGLPHGAVRLVLYANRELFSQAKVSPGRVRWQISERGLSISCGVSVAGSTRRAKEG